MKPNGLWLLTTAITDQFLIWFFSRPFIVCTGIPLVVCKHSKRAAHASPALVGVWGGLKRQTKLYVSTGFCRQCVHLAMYYLLCCGAQTHETSTSELRIKADARVRLYRLWYTGLRYFFCFPVTLRLHRPREILFKHPSYHQAKSKWMRERERERIRHVCIHRCTITVVRLTRA